MIKASVPIVATQSVPLIVRPETLSLVISPAGIGQARLMLRGDILGQGKTVIQAVRCNDWHLDWALTDPTSTNTSILTVSFADTRNLKRLPKELELDVRGNGITRVPIVARFEVRPTEETSNP
jgi:hypothetical protein